MGATLMGWAVGQQLVVLAGQVTAGIRAGTVGSPPSATRAPLPSSLSPLAPADKATPRLAPLLSCSLSGPGARLVLPGQRWVPPGPTGDGGD